MKFQTATICKNEEDIVKPWLETLLDLPQCEKIIICDQGSTDGTNEIIESYKDPRIDFYHTPPGTMNLDSRNSLMPRLDPNLWTQFSDVDEIFSVGYQDIFSYLDDMDLSNYSHVIFPFISMWDFDTIWHHSRPVTPFVENNMMYYGCVKNTTALYRYEDIKCGFLNNIHPVLANRIEFEWRNPLIASIKKSPVVSISDLTNDVFICHYSKSKLHAESRRTGRSFEYCVGKKRKGFRERKAVTYWNGKTYDAAWAKTATDADLEELGHVQLVQFMEHEGNKILEGYDAYPLNNEFITKYHAKP